MDRMDKKNSERREVTLRLEPQDFERLHEAAHQRRTSKQRLLMDALLQALGSPAAQTPAAGIRRRDADEKWHGILDEVLSDPDERIGIEKNLEWAMKTVREKRLQRKHGS